MLDVQIVPASAKHLELFILSNCNREGYQFDSSPDGMVCPSDHRFMIDCPKHLKLRDIFKMFLIEESSGNSVSPR